MKSKLKQLKKILKTIKRIERETSIELDFGKIKDDLKKQINYESNKKKRIEAYDRFPILGFDFSGLNGFTYPDSNNNTFCIEGLKKSFFDFKNKNNPSFDIEKELSKPPHEPTMNIIELDKIQQKAEQILNEVKEHGLVENINFNEVINILANSQFTIAKILRKEIEKHSHEKH